MKIHAQVVSIRIGENDIAGTSFTYGKARKPKRRKRSAMVSCRKGCGATSPRGEACAFCGPGEGE
jgi:hypothetical protein